MLRGVNVSGRNKLPMKDLRALLVAAGARDVRTYIQSGNAVFTSGRPPSTLVKNLENALERALGNPVPVLLRTIDELEAVIVANPFVARGEDAKVLHVTFLGEAPTATARESVSSGRGGADECAVIGRQVYLFCPHGYGTTKLTNAFFEKKLGTQATTRNWKTITTLAQLAHG
jgi:uncharacterized protein (DUF1697 family)